jgi:hypothetical protein
MTASLPELGGASSGSGDLAEALKPALAKLSETTDWLLETGAADLPRAAAGATPYLSLFGTVTGAWLLARGAAAARRRLANGGDEDRPFLEAKIATAKFYMANILPRASAAAEAVTQGAETTLALDEAQF